MIYFVPRNNTQNFCKAGSSSAHLPAILEVRLSRKQFLSKTLGDIIGGVHLMYPRYLKVSHQRLFVKSQQKRDDFPIPDWALKRGHMIAFWSYKGDCQLA